MPTCPNCGSVVMEGDPYCSHCGAHFKWSNTDDNVADYGGTFREAACHDSKTDYVVHDPFLDFGEVSENYTDACEEEL